MLQNISGAGTQRTPAVISTQQLPVPFGMLFFLKIFFKFRFSIKITGNGGVLQNVSGAVNQQLQQRSAATSMQQLQIPAGMLTFFLNF